MDLFNELLRIAETLNVEDRKIVLRAACECLPKKEPKFEKVEKIPGWGYQVISVR